MTMPTGRFHLLQYGVVAVFIYEALRERLSQGRSIPAPALLAVLATSPVGVLPDECIQGFLSSLVFDPQEILFNVQAGVLAVATGAVLGWARR